MLMSIEMTELMKNERDTTSKPNCVSPAEKCSVCIAQTECMKLSDPRLEGRNICSYTVQHLDLELELNTICDQCCRMLIEFHEFYMMVKRQHRALQCASTDPSKPETNKRLDLVDPEAERLFSLEFVEIKDEPLESMKEEEMLHESLNADAISITAADVDKVDETVAIKQNTEDKIIRTLRSKQIASPNLNSSKSKPMKVPRIDQDILEFYKRLVCEVCDPQKMKTCEPSIEYNNLKELNRHMRNSHGQEMGNVKCPMCDKKFRSRVKLLEHKDMHLNPDRFRCEQCKEIHQNIEEHIKNKHHERTYCCDDCEKRFPTKGRLNAHVRKMHTIKDVICDQCQKPFSKYTIKDHKRSVHESNFMCEHCPRTFKARLPLEQHLEEHKTGARPAATATCTICGTVVRDKYCLATHMKRLHTKHEPVNCRLCGKEFKSKHNLDAHLANVCTDRSFPCTICGKRFKKKIKLKEHMTTHTRSALYQCQYCPKTFSFETQLYTHRKQVHYEQWLELKRRRKEGERFKAKRITD